MVDVLEKGVKRGLQRGVKRGLQTGSVSSANHNQVRVASPAPETPRRLALALAPSPVHSPLKGRIASRRQHEAAIAAIIQVEAEEEEEAERRERMERE
ncbi:hypothetical protein VC83_09562 [Pseudogymnoascus destructans]|uniref:Uncharacterized protein n=1 Tax=Pseudogymnoascus destructans TaxID=655981 RepID=A0A176ZVZ8_9PEZI|nr:uncharacterized protein VC83_09562 [Pseudogymnoascus destructans]OAF54166.1 hypothetical protein VC83_09562 [Pseudogymnoascus destructans]